MRINTIKITRIALVAAVALTLSALEMMIPDLPIMVPGMKLGLSNIAIMFALVVIDLPAALFICLVKAVFALIMRGFTAFLLSFVGGVLSTIMMSILVYLKKPRFGYIGVGICGAFFHNFGQIIMVCLITDWSAIAYLPVLSLVSIMTGSITALVLSIVIPALIKTRLFN